MYGDRAKSELELAEAAYVASVAAAVGILTVLAALVLMAGWGAILVMLARSLDDLTPAAVARALTIGAGTWFCLDGLASIGNEAYLNLLANSVFLAVLVLPCLAILRSDKPARRLDATAG